VSDDNADESEDDKDEVINGGRGELPTPRKVEVF
jgi:hypothetical protein